MLRLVNVVKRYGAAAAVDGVDLEIPDGQMVGIIGRSGAGKSTLLRTINRLTDPTTGRIFYGDTDITGLRGRALNAWRARCALIFQQLNLVGRLDIVPTLLIGRARYTSPLTPPFTR